VEIEATIPAQVVAFGSGLATGAPASCMGDQFTNICSPSEKIVWDVGTLAPGNSVIVTMPPVVASGANAPANGTMIRFDALVRVPGSQMGAVTRSVVVDSERLLDLAVAGDADPVAPGQKLTYLLSFGNRTSTTLAPDAMLTLVLPVGTDFVSA